MADELREEISRLPANVAALAVDVATAARQVHVASASRWFGDASVIGPVGETYLVSGADLAWNFLFERRRGHTLFFFHFGETKWAPLEARLSMRMVPETVPAAAQPLATTIALPDFWIANPSAADLQRWAPAGSTAAGAVVLRIGGDGDVLALRIDPRRLNRSKLRYNKGGVSGPEWPQNGGFPIVHFLSLLREFGDWKKRGMPGGGAGNELQLSDSAGSGFLGDVIGGLTNAFGQAQASLSAMPAKPFAPAAWQLRDYAIEATVRLREDGSLPDRQSQERFTLKLRGAARGDNVLHLTAGQLDLLADPQLVQAALLDISVAPGKIRPIRHLLGVSLDPIAKAFLDSASDSATASFLEPVDDGASAYLFVLQGDLIGESKTLIARLVFRITRNARSVEAEFLQDEEATGVLLSTADLNSATIDREAASWFFGLARGLQKFRGLF